MPTETMSPVDTPSMTGLLSGIASDAHELVKQQVALVKAEIKADYRRTVHAVGLLAAGGVVAVPALVLTCHMAVYMLHELANLPMWIGNSIVGGALAVVSAVLIGIGVRRYRSVNLFPDQSVDALKENVRWMTNPK
jgi:hypothetical protein